MKKIFFLLFLLVAINSSAGKLKAVRKSGEVVYTNIGKNLFFSNAFRYSNYSKKQIIKLIEKIAKGHGVSVRLAKAIAEIESDFNPRSVSSANAKGVMQLMDETAKDYGVKNPFDPKENIKGGILFLRHLINKYHDPKLVAAAYNAGETAVDRYGGVPPYPETERYVRKFMRVYGSKSGVWHKYQKRGTARYRKIVKKGGVYTNIGVGLW